MESDVKLPDLLGHNLRLVICGTAAGHRSAARKAYYAGSGNRFWKILAATKLTPRELEPEEFGSVSDHGIGLTDLAKRVSGPDSGITKSEWDIQGLKGRLRKYSPKVVCFNGKKAAKEFFGTKNIAFGIQQECRDLPGIVFFVAPSTSGAARRYWDERLWHDLVTLVGV